MEVTCSSSGRRTGCFQSDIQICFLVQFHWRFYIVLGFWHDVGCLPVLAVAKFRVVGATEGEMR